MAGRKRTSKSSSNKDKKWQFGKGKNLSLMPQLAGNFSLRRRKKGKKNLKKLFSGNKTQPKSVKRHHTQVPESHGFISSRLRNRSNRRAKPQYGIVNDILPVGERSSQLKPQQLNWGK